MMMVIQLVISGVGVYMIASGALTLLWIPCLLLFICDLIAGYVLHLPTIAGTVGGTIAIYLGHKDTLLDSFCMAYIFYQGIMAALGLLVLIAGLVVRFFKVRKDIDQ